MIQQQTLNRPGGSAAYGGDVGRVKQQPLPNGDVRAMEHVYRQYQQKQQQQQETGVPHDRFVHVDMQQRQKFQGSQWGMQCPPFSQSRTNVRNNTRDSSRDQLVMKPGCNDGGVNNPLRTIQNMVDQTSGTGPPNGTRPASGSTQPIQTTGDYSGTNSRGLTMSSSYVPYPFMGVNQQQQTIAGGGPLFTEANGQGGPTSARYMARYGSSNLAPPTGAQEWMNYDCGTTWNSSSNVFGDDALGGSYPETDLPNVYSRQTTVPEYDQNMIVRGPHTSLDRPGSRVLPPPYDQHNFRTTPVAAETGIAKLQSGNSRVINSSGRPRADRRQQSPVAFMTPINGEHVDEKPPPSH